MAMIVTVLNAMWATIEGPRRPVRQASTPSTTPKPARPRNCSASKCARANTSAVRTIETAGARRRPRFSKSAEEASQEQAPEEQLLDDWAAETDEHGQHDEPRAEGVAGEALGGVTEPGVEMVDEGKQRGLDDRDEQVLGGHPGDDPERDVRPRPQHKAVVANDTSGAAWPLGGAEAAGVSARPPLAAIRVATTAAPTRPIQSPNRLTTSSPYWLAC